MYNPQLDDEKYMPGLENRAIRYYFYLNRGLDILNQFRNLFLGIIGVYLALKLENWEYLIAMFFVCVILLLVVGYYSTHRVNKLMEWLSVRFSTHYGRKQFENTEGILDTLKEINQKLGQGRDA